MAGAEERAALDPQDQQAGGEVTDRVYAELRSLAERELRKQHRGHTLQPTALVHEAYIRLMHYGQTIWADRAQFGAVAATCIRRILLDHARRSRAAKHGGNIERVTLLEHHHPQAQGTDVDLVALQEVLEELEGRDAQQARIIELRFFGGLTIEECARVLEVSTHTIKQSSRFALAWMRVRLGLPDAL